MDLKPAAPNPTLDALIERAKRHVMTPVERDEQMRSFVRGQTGHELPGPSLKEQIAVSFAAGYRAALKDAAGVCEAFVLHKPFPEEHGREVFEAMASAATYCAEQIAAAIEALPVREG